MSSCCLQSVSLCMEAVAHLQLTELTDRAVPNAKQQKVVLHVQCKMQEQSKLPLGSAETEFEIPYSLQTSRSASSSTPMQVCLPAGGSRERDQGVALGVREGPTRPSAPWCLLRGVYPSSMSLPMICPLLRLMCSAMIWLLMLH